MAANPSVHGVLLLTRDMDRVANAIEKNAELLGVKNEIAQDFVEKIELVATIIEKNAGIERDDNCEVVGDAAKVAAQIEANSNVSAGPGAEWNPAQIAEKKPGPLKKEPDEPFMNGEFTQQEFSELHDKQVSGQLPSADKMAALAKGMMELAVAMGFGSKAASDEDTYGLTAE